MSALCLLTIARETANRPPSAYEHACKAFLYSLHLHHASRWQIVSKGTDCIVHDRAAGRYKHPSRVRVTSGFITESSSCCLTMVLPFTIERYTWLHNASR